MRNGIAFYKRNIIQGENIRFCRHHDAMEKHRRVESSASSSDTCHQTFGQTYWNVSPLLSQLRCAAIYALPKIHSVPSGWNATQIPLYAHLAVSATKPR